MDVSSIEPFKKLCEYAVKSYIYTNLIFDIESNVVFRGQELGVIKDIVGQYSDSEDKYTEQLLAFGGAAIYEPDRLRNILIRCVPKR